MSQQNLLSLALTLNYKNAVFLGGKRMSGTFSKLSIRNTGKIYTGHQQTVSLGRNSRERMPVVLVWELDLALHSGHAVLWSQSAWCDSLGAAVTFLLCLRNAYAPLLCLSR